MTTDYEVQTVYRCPSCDNVSEDEAGPLYECGRCGETYNRENSADGESNRCPTDNIFGAKIAEWTCWECGEEVEEVQGVQLDDSSDEWLVLEGEGTVEEQVEAALARQAEEERQEAERQRAADEKQAADRRRYEDAPTKPVTEVAVGDVLLIHNGSRIDEFVVGSVGPWKERIFVHSGRGSFGYSFERDDQVRYLPQEG